MEKQTKGTHVQGTEVATEKGKKKQKVSITYTLTSTKNNIEKLKENGYLTEEEDKAMKEILNKAIKKYTTKQFGIL